MYELFSSGQIEKRIQKRATVLKIGIPSCVSTKQTIVCFYKALVENHSLFGNCYIYDFW